MFRDRYFQAFLVLLGLWIIFQILVMGFWPLPDLDGDEAWNASMALGLLKHGWCRSTLLAGSSLESQSSMSFTFWAYTGFQACFIKVLGAKILSVRLPSLLAGVAAVFTSFKLGESLSDRKSGFFAACALMFSVPFTGISHYGRPEIFLALGFVLVAFACLSEPERDWKALAAGFAGAALFTVYPLGPAVGLAALLFPLVTWRPRTLLWTAIGFAAGCALLFFTNVLPFLGQEAFLEIQHHYELQFLPGLLLRNPLAVPFKLLKRIALDIPWQVIPMYGFWTPCVAALGLGGLFLARNRRLGIFFVLLLLAAALWFPRYRYSYFVMFLPFLAVGFGAFLAQLGPRLRWVLLALLLVPEIYYAQRELRLAHAQASAQARVYREVSEAIPEGSKALGTSTRFFWPLGESYGFPASPDYVSGKISLPDFMKMRGAEYLVVEEHDYPALPIENLERQNPHANQNFAKSMDVFESDVLSDTSVFVPVREIPGGYLDVREVIVYRLR